MLLLSYERFKACCITVKPMLFADGVPDAPLSSRLSTVPSNTISHGSADKERNFTVSVSPIDVVQ